MIKISKITTQKRKRNRFNIFLTNGNEEQYGFSVDEDILIKYHLRKGLELDEVTIRTLKQQDTIQKSYTDAIHYLGYRMRSEKEIRDYLARKEVDREHITYIIERLINEGYVNDEEFAAMFVRNRINMSEKGPSLVKQELMHKGISNSIATSAIMPYTYEVQYEKASKVAEKRMRRKSNHSYRRQLDQLRANLMRSGFTNDVINDVISEVQAMDPDAEWDSIVYHGDRLSRRHQSKFSGKQLEEKIKGGLLRQGFTFSNVKAYLDKTLNNHE